jgi:transcription-repair coupling factor (superfamily II helicase)
MGPQIAELKAKIRDSESFVEGYSALLAGESVIFDGMVGNSPLLIASVLAEESGKLIVLICPNIGEVDTVADDLALFTDAQILTYPILPSFLTESGVHTDGIFLSEDRIFGQRLRVLKELHRRCAPDFALTSLVSDENTPLVNRLRHRQTPTEPMVKTPPAILVTSFAAIRQPIPVFSEIEAETRVLESGRVYNRDELLVWLAERGFHPTSAVELPGEYSVRGGILDIYAVDWTEPVRIEFFDDEIESIRSFEIKTQRSLADMASVQITALRSSSRVTGMFVDHLPAATIPVMLETGEILRQAAKIDRYFAEKFDVGRNESALESTEPEISVSTEVPPTSSKDSSLVRPFSTDVICSALYRFPTLHAVTIVSGTELAPHVHSFLFQTIERLHGNLPSLREEIDRYPEKVRFEVVCRNEAEQRRIAESFSDSVAVKQGRIDWHIGTLARGFAWPAENVVLVGTDELFGRANIRRAKSRTLSESIDSFVDLSPGDLVVHVGHGLARFRGLVMREKGQQEEEHLELEFADNVVLYVSTSKINLIQKYVGTSQLRPKLAKLNGKAWNRQKNEVREAVFDLAADMLELQAKREALQGFACPPDSDWQHDFEETFPFEPTEDQLLAIEAIKKDMESPRPMDRLLCGDVGFGKTEVAVRAAFKAVNAGYQVGVLVPTTILAEQHYHVFSERMSAFPVRIGVLSRFCSKKEITETLEKLRLGKLDVIIGTHRLVQKDVIFKNLGLVIIDEEQRFGVNDKDFLKHLRSQVDVLTMTATPIPRTLHFSLLGLRDISNLQTPPDDRLPIETKILRFNPEAIRNGILYEMSRGGQVFFLHNRVQDIDDLALKLSEIVPEARIGISHARMSNNDLEKVLRRFVNREYDVLLSTTIIENGIDIPNANTIFINHANRFGLAELHQLRGRVGRYRNQAYCYLLLAPNAPMTRESLQRLKAIEEYSHLGAGFQLALRDLELRGAGNILGIQQSGHINLVGYEMYCEFLESAIRLLKNMPQKVKIDVQVDLPGLAMIPDNYVTEIRDKLDLYRRLSRITNEEEADTIRAEISDRFGKIPKPAERLIVCAKIRVNAWKYSIGTVNLFDFSHEKFVNFKFKSRRHSERLRQRLFGRKVDLRILNEEQAVVPIPKTVLGDSGNPDPDRLLYYVLNLLKE